MARRKKKSPCTLWQGRVFAELPPRCPLLPVVGLDHCHVQGEWIPTDEVDWDRVDRIRSRVLRGEPS